MPIEELLTRIADVLASHNEAEWAKAFRRLYSEYRREPELAKSAIRSVYGGMGSFNDLVLLSSSGSPLVAENNELDCLRAELFESCR